MDNRNEFYSNNCIKEKQTFSRRKADILLIPLLLILALCFVIPFFLIWKGHLKNQINDFNFWIFEFSLIGGGFMHEFIHGMVAATFSKKGFRSVKIGFKKKILTPYCHIKEALRLKHYILVAMMPCIVLGAIPLILGLVIGSIWLFFLGVILTLSASRDIYSTVSLWKEDWELWVMDDPSELGCYICRPK